MVSTTVEPATPPRRQAIIHAALAVMTRDGVGGMRAQSLAQEAGVSVATPYHYFPSLDDVVHAAFASAHADVARRRDAVRDAAGDDPVGQLRAVLAVDFIGSAAAVHRRWILRLEFQRAAMFDEALRSLVCASEQMDCDRLTDILRRAQGAREVPDAVDATLLAERLLALSCGLGSLVLTKAVTPTEAAGLLADAVDDRASWRTPGTTALALPPLDAPEPPVDRATQILDATITVIARLGINGTTYRLVAAEAGTSLALPRYYFPTLRELFAAAFARDEALARERMVRTAGDLPDPRSRLRHGRINATPDALRRLRPSQIMWLEQLRLAEHDPTARTAARARLAAWHDYGLALGHDLAAVGAAPAARIRSDGAWLAVALHTGASGLWMIGLLADARYAAAVNGGVDDLLGIEP